MFEIKVVTSIDEQTTGVCFAVYQDNIDYHSLSVQTKPILSKVGFYALCNNEHVYKVLIKVNNRIEGIILATDNLVFYPESHYSGEYFLSSSNAIFTYRKTIFFIGDRGGVNLSKVLRNRIRRGDVNVKQLFNSIFNAFSEALKMPFHIIWNQSEHSDRMILMKEPYLDFLGVIKQITEVKFLDRETFVHIHWMENVFHKSRMIWSLKFAGKFNQNNVYDNGTVSAEDFLFSTKRFFGNKYYISHQTKVDSELAESFYNVYHERLHGINEKSPQRLEYDKKDFLEYLADQRIDKYILWNRNKEISGGCLLISKNNSGAAHWVTKEWRLADAYIKLIFVNKGEARFAYLVLFAVATYHLLKHQGTIDNSRILADWSDNLNGSRFRQALNIRQVPFLPKFVGVQIGVRPDKLFAKLLIGIANFRATLLDNDLYYQIDPR
ncbi:MAG: hypothetical protein V1685_03580 [Parcubacteria group bacterium]